LRGEYLYAAEGIGGFRVYDVASIANKGVSERIITAPFSPLGDNTHVKTADATCVALPTNQPIAPLRMYGNGERRRLMQQFNQEQPIHPIYSYAFITDAVEGLIAVNVDTLADGDPRNNFLRRALTWNENGILTGAKHLTIAGNIFYVTTAHAVVILDMNDPLKPALLAQLPFEAPRASAVQFRYLFVTDAIGLHVVDITTPNTPRVISGATVTLRDAHRIYVARTYAYVADGRDGLAIVDVERPQAPKLFQLFNADGRLKDVRDVVIGSTNASLFAYVADGIGGLKVLQLTSPESQPAFYGFSPEPRPELIAWRDTQAPAFALSKGLDRDRAVDETGHQIAVFGRLGSRPMNLIEQQRLYLRGDALWTVSNSIDSETFVPGASPQHTEFKQITNLK
jgi:hypothetical protein